MRVRCISRMAISSPPNLPRLVLAPRIERMRPRLRSPPRPRAFASERAIQRENRVELRITTWYTSGSLPVQTDTRFVPIRSRFGRSRSRTRCSRRLYCELVKWGWNFTNGRSEASMHDRAIGKRLGVAPYKACECGSIRDHRTEHVPRDNLLQKRSTWRRPIRRSRA